MARTKHTDPGLTFESVMNPGGKAKRSAVTEGKKNPKTSAKPVSAKRSAVTEGKKKTQNPCKNSVSAK